MNHKFGIVIHGGAGTILRIQMTPEKETAYREKLRESLKTGYDILRDGGTSLDAVQAAVNVMEDSPLFNAGVGAVFTHEGKNEQDACIMDGVTLNSGAVAGTRHIKNPIDLARLVMERSDHVLLLGDGAEKFALEHGMEPVDESYFFTEHRWQQLQAALKKEERSKTQYTQLDHTPDDKHGTVGAVALDKAGNLAAATSSGGMTNKRFGRVGDSPIVGAGNYANNRTCAISCTGHGEYFITAVAAYDVSAMMEYKGLTLDEAARQVIHDKLSKLGGTGGLIGIDRSANITLPFNTPGMYRGYLLDGGEPVIGIFEE